MKSEETTDFADILYWEQRLATAEFRLSTEEVAELFDDAFIEFGASGRCFTKIEILELLNQENDFQDYAIEDFEVKQLSDTTYLATYRIPPRVSRSNIPTRGSLRSSIWQKTTDGKWVLIFHQGTHVPRTE